MLCSMRVLALLVISVAIALGISLPSGASPARAGLIAFERDYSIYVVNPDGSGLRLLAKKGEQGPGEGDGLLLRPAFTPDGSRITYVNGYRTTHQSVVVRRIAGGPPKLYAVDGTLLNSPLSFSPDGRFAVISRLGDPPPHSAIFVASTTRRAETQLTGIVPRRNVYHWSPDFSPDGQRIAFTQQSGNRSPRLMVLTRATRAVGMLVFGEAADWSPDGNRIAFVRKDGVYTCASDGTNIRRLFAVVDPGPVDYSPDGQRLAFVARGAVWVMPAEGGTPTRIVRGATGGLDWG
jgi:Tol biopolymer transport system component